MKNHTIYQYRTQGPRGMVLVTPVLPNRFPTLTAIIVWCWGEVAAEATEIGWRFKAIGRAILAEFLAACARVKRLRLTVSAERPTATGVSADNICVAPAESAEAIALRFPPPHKRVRLSPKEREDLAARTRVRFRN